ncbi:MAG: tRNA-dihydrouridine synthase [Planctomycetota bacterium]
MVLEHLVPGFDRPYFLAGLAGYSDGPMRLVARSYGAPYCVTESLLAGIVLRGGRGLTQQHPDRWIDELRASEPRTVVDNRAATFDDHPISAQVIGSDVDEVAEAAGILAEQSFDGIDVNLACPSKKKGKQREQGGNLLAQPDRAIAMLTAVRRAVPRELPTTVKLRRAFDDSREMRDTLDRIVDAAFKLGYAWVTVHGRTVEQRYEGLADWGAIRRLVERHPGSPILGSGDVYHAADIFRRLEEVGVAAVAVARGAIGNPWIFREAEALSKGASATPPTLVERIAMLEEHATLALALHGESRATRTMRKFSIQFAKRHLAGADTDWDQRFANAMTLEEWRRVLKACRDSAATV